MTEKCLVFVEIENGATRIHVKIKGMFLLIAYWTRLGIYVKDKV